MTEKWRVRHPGIGVLVYGSKAEARVAAGTAGEVLPPKSGRPGCHDCDGRCDEHCTCPGCSEATMPP